MTDMKSMTDKDWVDQHDGQMIKRDSEQHIHMIYHIYL